MPQAEWEQHILNSVHNALADFQRRYGDYEYGTMKLYVDKAVTPGMETEIFVDAHYRHMPLRDYNGMMGVMRSVVSDYDEDWQEEQKEG